MSKRFKPSKEAKKLAARPYTRVILFKNDTYFGIVPELGYRTNHDDLSKINEWIDDLILTVIHYLLEDGLEVPAPHVWGHGEEILLVSYDTMNARFEK